MHGEKPPRSPCIYNPRVTILVRIAETGGVVDKKETKTKKFPLCFSKLNTLIFYYFGCKM